MQDSDIRKLIFYASTMWRTFEVPADELTLEVTIQSWHDCLDDFDSQTIRAAMVRLSKNPFAPTPGELREECRKAVMDASGEPGIPTLDESWTEVMNAVRLVGMYGKPEWSHEVIQRTMTAFGWVEFCTCTDPIGVLRGQFRQFHEAAVAGYEQALAGPTPLELAYREERRQRALDEGATRILASPLDEQ